MSINSKPSREDLGKMVRDIWIEWGHEQPDAQPFWFTPWEDLSDEQKDFHMRIGERVFEAGEKFGRNDELGQ